MNQQSVTHEIIAVLSAAAPVPNRAVIGDRIRPPSSVGRRRIGLAAQVDHSAPRRRSDYRSAYPFDCDAVLHSPVDAVVELVEPGSGVVTDAWAGYASLPKRGFNHTVSRGGAPNVGGNLLPHVHRVAALLKRWLLGTHQGAIRREHLQAYLDEFVFRFNRRTASSRALLFRGLLEQALNHPPVTLPRLIGKA